MKREVIQSMMPAISHFSTLDSGLRDETGTGAPSVSPPGAISVPSTRVYAMKRRYVTASRPPETNFSTLDSGLRDETEPERGDEARRAAFQYPRLGSTR